MGLFDKLKGVFGGGKKADEEEDSPLAGETDVVDPRKSTVRKTFSLSTGQVYRPPSTSGRQIPDKAALKETVIMPAPAPEEEVIGEEAALPFDPLPPSMEELDAGMAMPLSLDETADLGADVPRPDAATTLKGPANVTARMVAVGRATPEEAAASRSAASLSLRKAIAGTAVSHKRRVSAKNKMLGALLVADNVLDDDKLDEILALQQKNGGLLGQIVRGLGLANDDAIGDSIKKQRTITTVTLATAKIDMDVVKILDKEFCLKHRLLPFERFGNLLCLAMTNVLDTQAKNLVRERSNMQLKPFDAEWGDLSAMIEKVYARPGEKDGGRRTATMTSRVETGAVSEALAAAETVGTTEMFAKLSTKPLPRTPLAAIPAGGAFASEVIQWDAADTERRWMATQLADNRLPLLPSMDAV